MPSHAQQAIHGQLAAYHKQKAAKTNTHNST
jgi:hypothetical protein